MSFSTNVKEDILQLNSDNLSHLVELEALFRLGGEVILGNPLKISFSSVHMSLVRHVIKLMKKFYIDVTYEIVSRKMQKLNRVTIYSCVIVNQAKTILEELALLDPIPVKKEEILSEPYLMLAYLRGAFLVKGSVNNPSTSNYHLEIGTDKETEALFLQRCMNYYSLNARITKRRSHLIVYIKEKDSIIDFLRRIGANVTMNEFENVMIKREIAANVNRMMNIDVANQQKTNKSSKEQLKYIKYMEYHYPLEKLDPKLLIVMKIRKENPEASLMELIEIIKNTYEDNITKSGLNHRFRKIKELAIDFENRRKEKS